MILFSDDVRLANKLLKNNLKINIKTINDKSLTFLDEFALMCVAKNFIISNSTFSWWAAFCNSNNKVAAPTPWVDDPEANIILEKGLTIEEWNYFSKEDGRAVQIN